jgi:glycerol-3-phosphate dehydrogenase
MTQGIVRDTPYDVAVIGAGVVGCAIARELARYEVSVVVLERSGDVGNGTSKANTAILHTGFDCVPGSLESSLVSRGYHLLGAYAEEAGIALERTGGLLVAWDDEQQAALTSLQEKAEKNGYDATQILSAAQVRDREPNLGEGVRGGLAVPGESIICPWSTVLAYALEAASAGVSFLLNAQVTAVARVEGLHVLATGQGDVRSRWLVNAAGLFSSDVDGLCDHDDFTVTPRRGELVVFDKLARDLITSIILPVPTQRTKGVLIAPTVYGNVLLGPTADDVDDPFATATTEQGITRLFEAARKVVPKLVDEEVTATYAGLRAATQFQDYQIRVHAGEAYVCVGGIRSTGLTASMAIAEYVTGLLGDEGLELTARTLVPETPDMAPLGEQQLRRYLDAAAIGRDPAYGQVVCHCERVTQGEIRDACTGVLGANDLGALRRRTRAMNGRCQGFYCGAEVVALLSELSGRSPAALTGLDS